MARQKQECQEVDQPLDSDSDGQDLLDEPHYVALLLHKHYQS